MSSILIGNIDFLTDILQNFIKILFCLYKTFKLILCRVCSVSTLV